MRLDKQKAVRRKGVETQTAGRFNQMHNHYYQPEPQFDAEMFAAVDESVYEHDMVAAEREFYFRFRVIDAFCEVCSEQDKGTAMQLEKMRGWKLTSREQFCPMHREG